MKLTLEDARHLATRTGFGEAPTTLRAWSKEHRTAVVRALLAGVRRQPQTTPPSWVSEKPPSEAHVRADRKGFRKEQRRHGRELMAWWYKEMLETSSPLTERMVLFWHGHFTSSLQKAKWTPLMYRQNQLFRRHGLGHFGELLTAVMKDPAMLMYLDGQSNHRDQPNENFARELLELFTLGEGHYTESDIKAAARALTGMRVNRRRGTYRFAEGAHDSGSKTFLGKTGNLGPSDIVATIVAHKRTAEYIVERLWRMFISDEPDTAEVTRIAAIFRKRYQIREAVEALLLSRHFWDSSNRGNLIKSPVELAVGTLRLLDVAVDDMKPIAKFGASLGQILLSPPNVKGWPGGTRWITSHTLLLRRRGLRRALRSEQVARRFRAGTPAVAQWLGVKGDATPSKVSAELRRCMLATAPAGPLDNSSIKSAVTSLVLDPAFQLK